MDLGNRASFEPIGISCRICERTGCAARAMPPLKGRLIIDHDRRAVLPYRLKEN
jgi:XRE family transcriptional regulator, fatty acid utilization regulator